MGRAAYVASKSFCTVKRELEVLKLQLRFVPDFYFALVQFLLAMVRTLIHCYNSILCTSRRS